MAAVVRGTPIYDDILVACQNRRLWQMLIGAGAVIAVSVGGNVWQATRPAAPPYVFTVNEQGAPVGVIQPVEGTEQIPDIALRNEIERYIQNAFSVSTDFTEEKDKLAAVYAMSGGQAGTLLTAWYHDGHSPLPPEAKGVTECEIVRTLKLPEPDAYQVDYRTVHYVDRQDAPVTTNWRAAVKVEQGKPTATNRMGLLVTSLDFQPEQTMEAAK